MSLHYKVAIDGSNWGWQELLTVLRSIPFPELGESSRLHRIREIITRRYGCVPSLLNSGRSALELALGDVRGMVGQRDASIVVPSFICKSVVSKIVDSGFTPIFFDINTDVVPDCGDALNCIRSDTAAVLYPYLYGKTADISSLTAECKAKGIALIEDAAAAFLLRRPDGELAGASGDYVIFSFSVGKTVIAGSGGALLMRRPGSVPSVPEWGALEQRRVAFSKLSFYLTYPWGWAGYLLGKIGFCRSPSYVQRTCNQARPLAAVDQRLFLLQASKWESVFERKKAVLSRYATALKGSGLTLPQYRDGEYLNRLFVKFPFPIRSNEGRDLGPIAFLRNCDVQTQLPYSPVHRMSEYARYSTRSLSRTDDFANSALELATQPALSDDAVDYVCRCLINCVAAFS